MVLLTSPTTSTARGRFSVKKRLQPHHDGPGLLGVATRAYTQVDDRPGHAQIFEEDLRHGGVVVLPGVDQFVGDPRLAKGGVNGRRFHEVRSGSDDSNNHGFKPTIGKVV